MREFFAASAFVLAASVLACGGETTSDKPAPAPACPAILLHGLRLTVEDATTGKEICDARVFARNVNRGTLTTFDRSLQDCGYYGLYEVGPHIISILKDGFHPAELEIVVAMSTGDCANLITQDAKVRLEPAPALDGGSDGGGIGDGGDAGDGGS